MALDDYESQPLPYSQAQLTSTPTSASSLQNFGGFLQNFRQQMQGMLDPGQIGAARRGVQTPQEPGIPSSAYGESGPGPAQMSPLQKMAAKITADVKAGKIAPTGAAVDSGAGSFMPSGSSQQTAAAAREQILPQRIAQAQQLGLL